MSFLFILFKRLVDKMNETVDSSNNTYQ